MENSLFNQVYKELRNKVISGTWMVGERINEKELAQAMHVSRTPLRKALKLIYEEGLLDYTKNFGYHVRLITEEDVQEIYKLRVVLEILAFTEAAKKLTEKDIEEIEKILDNSQEAVNNKNFNDLIEWSNKYNKKIYNIANMPRLKIIQVNLQNYLSRFRIMSFSGTEDDRSDLAVKEHRDILNAMRVKDEVEIEKLIRKHLNRSYRYILDLVRKENEFN